MFYWNRRKLNRNVWRHDNPSCDIDLNLEFHVIADEDIIFDAISRRTFLLMVDMKVTKDGTEFIPRIVERMIEESKMKRNVNCPVEIKIVLTDETPVCARRIAFTMLKVVTSRFRSGLTKSLLSTVLRSTLHLSYLWGRKL